MLRRRCSRVLHRVPSLQEYKNEHELHEHHGAEYRCGKPSAPRRAKAYHPAKIRRDDPSRSTKLHSAATPTLKSATLADLRQGTAKQLAIAKSRTCPLRQPSAAQRDPKFTIYM